MRSRTRRSHVSASLLYFASSIQVEDAKYVLSWLPLRVPQPKISEDGDVMQGERGTVSHRVVTQPR